VNIFYQDSGDLKVGTIIKDGDSSLQVETQFGKKIKIKSNQVFLRFDHIGLEDFLEVATSLASDVDADLLWEGCEGQEHSFTVLSRRYFGAVVQPEQQAAVLMVLYANPAHFYKRNRGEFKPAEPAALAAAKASLKARKEREALFEQYTALLTKYELPNQFRGLEQELLYRPNKPGIENKAIDAAISQLNISRTELFNRLGVLPNPKDYHLGRFLFEFFPEGFDHEGLETFLVADDLELSHADIFSIDDAATTEIDDAFSVSRIEGNNFRIGIHIAAPALAILRDSKWDKRARKHLSTVYLPGQKITMFPEQIINQFSLKENEVVPAISMYMVCDPDLNVLTTETKLERVAVKKNLDVLNLDEKFNPEKSGDELNQCQYAEELLTLYRLAKNLQRTRLKDRDNPIDRREFSFSVCGDRVDITLRRRGSPIDLIVSEMMIAVNNKWAQLLSQNGLKGLYRVQSNGRGGLSVDPAPHEGLGLDVYAWASSPLRRYVDLENQRELIKLISPARELGASDQDNSRRVAQDFELAYANYAEFQKLMERFWCLRWLEQEKRTIFRSELYRAEHVRLQDIPLHCKVPNLPEMQIGEHVNVKLTDIDLMNLTVKAEFLEKAD
jgi:exoribonuclease-2